MQCMERVDIHERDTVVWHPKICSYSAHSQGNSFALELRLKMV